jgi:hypothetical protein
MKTFYEKTLEQLSSRECLEIVLFTAKLCYPYFKKVNPNNKYLKEVIELAESEIKCHSQETINRSRDKILIGNVANTVSKYLLENDAFYSSRVIQDLLSCISLSTKNNQSIAMHLYFIINHAKLLNESFENKILEFIKERFPNIEIYNDNGL